MLSQPDMLSLFTAASSTSATSFRCAFFDASSLPRRFRQLAPTEIVQTAQQGRANQVFERAVCERHGRAVAHTEQELAVCC